MTLTYHPRSRRQFLSAFANLGSQTDWPSWMPRLAFAPVNSAPRGDTLVVIFLRGAADALNMVVPHGEEAYYARRPTLNIPRPDDLRAASGQRTVDLDGFFGLHPALQPLLPAWQAEQLAIVQACGAPDESRSHFKAMALMERGVETEQGPASGWIGRHLGSLDTGNRSPLRAVGLGAMAPASLRGSIPAAAFRSIAEFHLGQDPQAVAAMQQALSALYAADEPLSLLGRETLTMIDTLQALNPSEYTPARSANYPASDFGSSLQQVAMLIKAEVGLEVAAVDLGGWDTHFAQGAVAGLMADLLGDLATGLAAFHADLHDHLGNLTIVVMSEFGRRLQENASLGTDHGHGSLMFLLGGAVAGGQIHGQWPGLQPDQLVGPGDLAVTTDYRDVLAEVVAQRLSNPAVDLVFPNHPIQFPGVLRT